MEVIIVSFKFQKRKNSEKKEKHCQLSHSEHLDEHKFVGLVCNSDAHPCFKFNITNRPLLFITIFRPVSERVQEKNINTEKKKSCAGVSPCDRFGIIFYGRDNFYAVNEASSIHVVYDVATHIVKDHQTRFDIIF